MFLTVEFIHEMSGFLFNYLSFPVAFFSIFFYLLAVMGIFSKEEKSKYPARSIIWPSITLQIPTFNEPVAVRCAKSCLKMDYPKDKFQIIIGDDSKNPEISKMIADFAKKHKDKILVTQRGNNDGFKPGNLNYMLKYSKGEIIVIFDSDFVPNKDFLKRVVRPFVEDKKVGCVQAKWSFLNENTNYISKLSTTLLLFYYNLVVPINKKLGVPFMFGSGEAVRKDLLLELGGWKEGSLTEDTDFSFKALKNGHKIVYLNDLKVKGEVPHTLKGLIKQQKRWAYGNTKAFLDHSKAIFFGPFSFLQKLMMTYTMSVGYLSTFLLLSFLITGTIFFFSQPPAPIDIVKFLTQTSKMFLITSGFLVGGTVALFKERKLGILRPAMTALLTTGILVSVGVCIGFFKALLGKKMEWSAIEKEGNLNAMTKI